MINYQQQAADFLAKYGIKFSSSFIAYDFHFEGDKECRNIYRLTLSRGKNRVSFRFGQSINATMNNEEPTSYDLLACLTKYDPGTFENFCSDFGYDTDSRKAYKTYKAVVKEWEKVSRFFTANELDELQEIN